MNDRNALLYGMVGGGSGAFIGDVHRKAAEFDGRCRLVAGCFSRDYSNTKETGHRLGLAHDRLYADYRKMAETEGQRPDPIDFVIVVTPNSSHYGAAKAFLEQGINVVCDKPLTVSVAEAEELERLARENELLFGVT